MYVVLYTVAPKEMHPRVLRELTDVLANPVMLIHDLIKSWQSGEVSDDWQREMLHPF